MSPIVIAPVTALVGLGLFERGFPGVLPNNVIYCTLQFFTVLDSSLHVNLSVAQL